MARTSSNGIVKHNGKAITKKTTTNNLPKYAYALSPYKPSDGGAKSYQCAGCDRSYSSSASLYQHKRTHHPELIRPRADAFDDDDRRFVCPEPGCDKCYGTSAGLYQHKRAKHPWLVMERERGYTRPEMWKKPLLPE